MKLTLQQQQEAAVAAQGSTVVLTSTKRVSPAHKQFIYR
jgi:hypothetical protein